MNREKAYRKAVCEVLENIQIDYGTGIIDIPVYDNKLETEDGIFVLVEAQTAQDDSNFIQSRWRCTLELSVYHVQQDSATFDIVDLVSEEIENRILGLPSQNNFAIQNGWNIAETFLQSVNSLKFKDWKNEAGTVVQKILQFNSLLIKQ